MHHNLHSSLFFTIDMRLQLEQNLKMHEWVLGCCEARMQLRKRLWYMCAPPTADHGSTPAAPFSAILRQCRGSRCRQQPPQRHGTPHMS